MINIELFTKDGEWTNEELYGMLEDYCLHECQKIDYILDREDLKKPNIMVEVIMQDLCKDKNLVDYYDDIVEKCPHLSSTMVSESWEQFIINTIRSTLRSHKSKHYITEF